MKVLALILLASCAAAPLGVPGVGDKHCGDFGSLRVWVSEGNAFVHCPEALWATAEAAEKLWPLGLRPQHWDVFFTYGFLGYGEMVEGSNGPIGTLPTGGPSDVWGVTDRTIRVIAIREQHLGALVHELAHAALDDLEGVGDHHAWMRAHGIPVTGREL